MFVFYESRRAREYFVSLFWWFHFFFGFEARQLKTKLLMFFNRNPSVQKLLLMHCCSIPNGMNQTDQNWFGYWPTSCLLSDIQTANNFNGPSPPKENPASAHTARAPAPPLPSGGGGSSLWPQKEWERPDRAVDGFTREGYRCRCWAHEMDCARMGGCDPVWGLGGCHIVQTLGPTLESWVWDYGVKKIWSRRPK